MNQIHLVGIVASPIKISEYTGKATGELLVKASFLMAVRRPGASKDQKGDIIRVETWNVQARNLAQYNDVRSRIAVSGHLRSEFYNPEGIPNGGQIRSAVVAEQIQYLTPKPATAAPATASAAEEEPAAAKAGRR